MKNFSALRLGTTDSSSLLLKSNNTTLLRLQPNGQVAFPQISPGMLYLDAAGNVQSSANNLSAPCTPAQPSIPTWSSQFNGPLFTCPAYQVGIGTYNIPQGIRFQVDGSSILNGNLGIGINPATAPTAPGTTPYRLLVNGKMGATEIYCSLGNPWPDYVFEPDYHLMPIQELKHYLKTNKHLPGIAPAATLQEEGLNVAEQLRQAYEKIEELYLYVIELEERVKKVEGSHER
jgi:hypothetical protein